MIAFVTQVLIDLQLSEMSVIAKYKDLWLCRSIPFSIGLVVRRYFTWLKFGWTGELSKKYRYLERKPRIWQAKMDLGEE